MQWVKSQTGVRTFEQFLWGKNKVYKAVILFLLTHLSLTSHCSLKCHSNRWQFVYLLKETVQTPVWFGCIFESSKKQETENKRKSAVLFCPLLCNRGISTSAWDDPQHNGNVNIRNVRFIWKSISVFPSISECFCSSFMPTTYITFMATG